MGKETTSSLPVCICTRDGHLMAEMENQSSIIGGGAAAAINNVYPGGAK